jgi:hypothetical protein
MPQAFTHIYTQRRIAELLLKDTDNGGVTSDFIRKIDEILGEQQKLNPSGIMLTPRMIGQAMAKWPKFAALGAVGPDMFFFLQDYSTPEIPCDEIMLALSALYYRDDQGLLDDPWEGILSILAETNQTFAKVLKFIIEIEKIWKKFKETWNKSVGIIIDNAAQIADDMSGGLLFELKEAYEGLKNALISIGAEEILSEVDIFSWFSLKMRNGFDEKSFLWSDMLHYRQTSRFPQRLFIHAREMISSENELIREHGQQLIAYAAGWVTHIGTDTITHPYVNQQTGGPFRTHWQRHHLIENHFDAYNYQCTGDGRLPKDDFIGWKDDYPSLSKSAIYFAVQIPPDIDNLTDNEKQGDLRNKKAGDTSKYPLPDGDDKDSTEKRNEMLDTDGELPDWLATIIVKSLIEVYADSSEGGLNELQEERSKNPKNLGGQKFQDSLENTPDKIGYILDLLGISKDNIEFSDLRKAIAPDTPEGLIVPQGFPLPWEIKATYRFMFSYFKLAYFSSFDMNKPKRPTWFTPPASDFDFGPPDFSGVSLSDPPLREVCKIAAALIIWIFKTIERIIQVLWDLIKCIQSGLTFPARYFIYECIELPTWHICQSVRQVLSHMAYIIPQSKQFYDDGELKNPSEIDLELITLGHTIDGQFYQALESAYDFLGNLDHSPQLATNKMRNPKSADYPWLPIRATSIDDLPGSQSWFIKQFNLLHPNAINIDPRAYVVEFRRPWGFPNLTSSTDPNKQGNMLEAPITTSGPYPQGIIPTDLLQIENLPISSKLRLWYEISISPEETDVLNNKYIGHCPTSEHNNNSPIGGPILFSTYLLGQIANNCKFSANFNLDGDRGFAYLCWDWIRGEDEKDNPRHQKYKAPVTEPEGTAGDTSSSDSWVIPTPIPASENPAPQYSPELKLKYIRKQDLGPN